MTIELRACPFCGYDKPEILEAETSVRVECPACNGRGPGAYVSKRFGDRGAKRWVQLAWNGDENATAQIVRDHRMELESP